MAREPLDPNYLKAIGKTMRELRGNLSPDEFQDKVGVSRASFYRYEKGQSGIDREVYNRICEALNISDKEWNALIKKHLNDQNDIV